MGKTLFIRADTNTQIGTGHAMRCLALAQAWQETGGAAHFVFANSTPAMEARLAAEGMSWSYLHVPPGAASDAAQTAALAQESGADWLIVDGYHFGAEYQKAIKRTGLQLLFIDDYGHAESYCADLLLNQNIYADESLYVNREPYTRLLLGTRYVLLRREFWPWRGWQREIPQVARKVLVTLGGADPDNQTFKVIRALRQVNVDGFEATVVVGASNPHFRELEMAIRHLSPCAAIRLVRNVANMPALMAWADVAVSAGGSTCWELAFMGLPSLLLALADNQRAAVGMLSTVGVVLSLEKAAWSDAHLTARRITTLIEDYQTRAMMSQKGQHLVDGLGVTQVLESLN